MDELLVHGQVDPLRPEGLNLLDVDTEFNPCASLLIVAPNDRWADLPLDGRAAPFDHPRFALVTPAVFFLTRRDFRP